MRVGVTDDEPPPPSEAPRPEKRSSIVSEKRFSNVSLSSLASDEPAPQHEETPAVAGDSPETKRGFAFTRISSEDARQWGLPVPDPVEVDRVEEPSKSHPSDEDLRDTERNAEAIETFISEGIERSTVFGNCSSVMKAKLASLIVPKVVSAGTVVRDTIEIDGASDPGNSFVCGKNHLALLLRGRAIKEADENSMISEELPAFKRALSREGSAPMVRSTLLHFLCSGGPSGSFLASSTQK